MPFETPHHWRELLYRIERRVMADVEESWRRLDGPAPLLKPIQEALHRALERHLDEADEWWFRGVRRAWLAEQSETLREVARGQSRVIASVGELERKLIERVAGMEQQLRDCSNSCRYGESNAEIPWVGSYMSIAPAEAGRKAEPDPTGFMDKLKRVAKDASVLALVEPYALADANDTGERGDCLGQLLTLIQGLSLNQLHLYCRLDAASIEVVNALEQSNELKKKIKIHVGDLHDRYLLSGSEEKGDFVSWQGCSRWKGSVFGASLNGVSKRPTYVLPFEVGDVQDVIRYLKDHTTHITLENLKQKLQASLDKRNGARAARTKDEGEIPPKAK